MAVGFLILLVLLVQQFGSPANATTLLLQSEDLLLRAKATPPDLRRCVEWLSYVLIVGLGASLYPQALQRIYAARSARTLRRSLQGMALLAIPTQLIALVVGIAALAYLPGLEGMASDQVLGRIMAIVQADSRLGAALVVVLMAAILAAMMSTADSALLSISSMLAKDLAARWSRRNLSEQELTRLGKLCSFSVISLLVAVAILLQDNTSLVALLDRKFDLLVQLSPAFILGLRWRRLSAAPVLVGLLVGLAMSLTLAYGDFVFVHQGKVFGIHPGLVGLSFNLGIAVVGSSMGRAPTAAAPDPTREVTTT